MVTNLRNLIVEAWKALNILVYTPPKESVLWLKQLSYRMTGALKNVLIFSFNILALSLLFRSTLVFISLDEQNI